MSKIGENRRRVVAATIVDHNHLKIADTACQVVNDLLNRCGKDLFLIDFTLARKSKEAIREM